MQRPAKKHAARKAAKPKGPTVEEQIQALRQEMQGQIDSLKNNLADKDAQLKQAQQAAADAQAAAAKAQQAADAQQQAVTDNTAAVSTLQSTVTDMKANQRFAGFHDVRRDSRRSRSRSPIPAPCTTRESR